MTACLRLGRAGLAPAGGSGAYRCLATPARAPVRPQVRRVAPAIGAGDHCAASESRAMNAPYGYGLIDVRSHAAYKVLHRLLNLEYPRVGRCECAWGYGTSHGLCRCRDGALQPQSRGLARALQSLPHLFRRRSPAARRAPLRTRAGGALRPREPRSRKGRRVRQRRLAAPLLGTSCPCVRHDVASCHVTHRGCRLPLHREARATH
jgi:hypothetical protein